MAELVVPPAFSVRLSLSEPFWFEPFYFVQNLAGLVGVSIAANNPRPIPAIGLDRGRHRGGYVYALTVSVAARPEGR